MKKTNQQGKHINVKRDDGAMMTKKNKKKIKIFFL
jgi:hypothetical protein